MVVEAVVVVLLFCAMYSFVHLLLPSTTPLFRYRLQGVSMWQEESNVQANAGSKCSQTDALLPLFSMRDWASALHFFSIGEKLCSKRCVCMCVRVCMCVYLCVCICEYQLRSLSHFSFRAGGFIQKIVFYDDSGAYAHDERIDSARDSSDDDDDLDIDEGSVIEYTRHVSSLLKLSEFFSRSTLTHSLTHSGGVCSFLFFRCCDHFLIISSEMLSL